MWRHEHSALLLSYLDVVSNEVFNIFVIRMTVQRAAQQLLRRDRNLEDKRDCLCRAGSRDILAGCIVPTNIYFVT